MMKKILLPAVAILLCASANGAETSSKNSPSPDEGAVVLENELLRVTVSPLGGRAISVFDKVRQREEVKNLPYVGGLNEIRYGAALNLDEGHDRFTLTPSRLPDGTQSLQAVAKALPTDSKPGAATVTKRYTLAPKSSVLHLSLEVHNDGQEELGLIPWMRNLLLRGTAEQPEEAHMTENGAYLSSRPHPSTRTKAVQRMDFHYFPATNWTSRVPLPIDEHANSMVIVTRPEDMFKLYNWHRGQEDFSTFEVIAQPFFAQPGASFRWDYSMLWTPPVRNTAYASTELVIGVSPVGRGGIRRTPPTSSTTAFRRTGCVSGPSPAGRTTPRSRPSGPQSTRPRSWPRCVTDSNAIGPTGAGGACASSRSIPSCSATGGPRDRSGWRRS